MKIIKKVNEEFPKDKGKMSSLYVHYRKHTSADGMGRYVDPRTPDEDGYPKITGVNKDEYNAFTFEEYPEASDYDKAADRLARQVVHNSDPNSKDRYLGYIKEDGKRVKWDSVTKEITVYKVVNGRPVNISYSRAEKGNRYQRMYYSTNGRDGYKADIPEDEFK